MLSIGDRVIFLSSLHYPDTFFDLIVFQGEKGHITNMDDAHYFIKLDQGRQIFLTKDSKDIAKEKDITEFLDRLSPFYKAQYYAYCSESYPSIGEQVKTLVNGYTGLKGVIRTVIAHEYRGKTCIVLQDSSQQLSLCYKEAWWKDMVPVKYLDDIM